MKTLLTAMFCFVFVFVSLSQVPCGVDHFDKLYLRYDKSLLERRKTIENQTLKYYQDKNISKRSGSYIIPVVFHVMHDYGKENVSKAIILNVVKTLNEDFSSTSKSLETVLDEFKGRIGNPEIEFRLAGMDPEGNLTDGITRNATFLTNGGNDLLKSIVQWPPDQYLNIWVEKSTLNYFVAYSSFPGVHIENDGIVISADILNYKDLPENSKLLSHEIGHYLNLLHPWGISNDIGSKSNCEGTDYVNDTPCTVGTIYCNLNQSICQKNVVENVQNIMDYSSCKKMFTRGQVERMHASLNSDIGGRSHLWQAKNLVKTGVDREPSYELKPIADFSNHVIRICAGEMIKFEQQSYGGNFDFIKWEFDGGSIKESNETSPEVFYNIPGYFNVRLVVSNDSGRSELLRENLVEVYDYTQTLKPPFMLDFENSTFADTFLSFENHFGSGGWKICDVKSANSRKSLCIHNDENNNSYIDVFCTNGFDLSKVKSPHLSFKLAIPNTENSLDWLKMYSSVNCGQKWTLIYSKQNESLMTTSDTTSSFDPGDEDWREDVVDISHLEGELNVRFKVEFLSGGKNSIFIDNFSIVGLVSTEKVISKIGNIKVFPNPSSGNVNLLIDSPKAKILNYCVYNSFGKKILEDSIKNSFSDKIEIPLNFSLHGIYLLNIEIDGVVYTKIYH